MARGAPGLTETLCSNEPFDMRDPQFNRLQRQMRGTRRRQPVSDMDAKCLDVSQPRLDGRFAYAHH